MSDVRTAYAQYYAEKLWEMLPAVYRTEDGLASPPGQFRGLVEVVADRVAELRIDQDRLWDDQSIDLSDDWVVPYIGELLATRLLSARNARGRRIDVAKTIYYRRRKGTPRVLEELISDIAGWDGKVVEEFRRLARVRHGLDPKPLPLAGRFTGTPPGGIADIRRSRGSMLAGSPFDEFHYTPDSRRPRGREGRYGISKVGIHLYRLMAIPVTGAQPMVWPSAPGAPRRASIDPSGRDVHIFMRRDRSEDWDDWESADEWALPAPMECRVLGHAEYLLTDAEVAFVRTTPLLTPAARASAAAELLSWVGTTFPSEGRFRRVLASFTTGASLTSPGVFDALLESALVDDCGKARLLPNGTDEGSIAVRRTPGSPVPLVATTSGDLATWSTALGTRALAIDPERGRLLFAAGAGFNPRVDYALGLAAPIGATPVGRGPSLSPPSVPPVPPIVGGAMPAALDPVGVNQIDDSHTYGQPPNRTGVDGMVIQAEDGKRPFVRLAGPWTLTAAPAVEAELTLNGLWLGGAGGGPMADLRLAGDYEHVRLINVTLDPGGKDALDQTLRPVRLVVTGAIETLEIEGSIIAGVFLQAGGSVENLIIRDSIVRASDEAATPPLALPATRLTLERSSLLWNRADALATIGVDVAWLYASEALVTCRVDVTNLQDGCFRFSAAASGSRVPHPYESHMLTDLGALFDSWRFGDAAFAVLAETAPAQVARGGLDGREMGAFAALNWPIRRDGLAAKIDEFMPFGLAPAFIDET